MWIYLGGIMAIVGGLISLVAGGILVSGIGKANAENEARAAREVKEEQERMDAEEVERIRQERIAAREQEEEEKKQAIEEREYSTTCWVEIDAPASIAINGTGTVTATVSNESEEIVKNIEFDLGDLEYYFNVQGGLKFTSVTPGQELTGSIKIKPKKEEEGIYPILIEIKLDDEKIERRFSIRVEGKDSY